MHKLIQATAVVLVAAHAAVSAQDISEPEMALRRDLANFPTARELNVMLEFSRPVNAQQLFDLVTQHEEIRIRARLVDSGSNATGRPLEETVSIEFMHDDARQDLQWRAFECSVLMANRRIEDNSPVTRAGTRGPRRREPSPVAPEAWRTREVSLLAPAHILLDVFADPPEPIAAYGDLAPTSTLQTQTITAGGGITVVTSGQLMAPGTPMPRFVVRSPEEIEPGCEFMMTVGRPPGEPLPEAFRNSPAAARFAPLIERQRRGIGPFAPPELNGISPVDFTYGPPRSETELARLVAEAPDGYVLVRFNWRDALPLSTLVSFTDRYQLLFVGTAVMRIDSTGMVSGTQVALSARGVPMETQLARHRCALQGTLESRRLPWPTADGGDWTQDWSTQLAEVVLPAGEVADIVAELEPYDFTTFFIAPLVPGYLELLDANIERVTLNPAELQPMRIEPIEGCDAWLRYEEPRPLPFPRLLQP